MGTAEALGMEVSARGCRPSLALSFLAYLVLEVALRFRIQLSRYTMSQN